MPKDIDEDLLERLCIARELFVDTADENYAVARWSYFQGLHVDFAWGAVHALEKYYKAILLMNGRSARAFSHDITALHPVVQELVGDLLPLALIRPPGVGPHWRDESVEAFTTRLYRDGNADNRYFLFGYAQHPADVHKLDVLVFALRRLCEPLDAYFLPRHIRESDPGKTDFTYADLLRRQPDYWDRIGGRLAGMIDGKRGPVLQETVMHQNFAFAPADAPPTAIQLSTASHNPILWRHILMPLEQGSPETKAHAKKAGLWVLDNIRIPKDVADQIRDAIAKA